MPNTTQIVCNNIIDYCAKRDVSIKSFEEFCGLANGVIARWEKGNATPTLASLDKIQQATGISVGYWTKKRGNK